MENLAQMKINQLFQEMLAAAKLGTFDALLIENIARLPTLKRDKPDEILQLF